ncbi:hypothetical protein HDU99_004999 [Rhizoclosmatium hyalinum]|nr:hypothetical protein HDU99_004999 [Rhizoclosmatium hyalinum]
MSSKIEEIAPGCFRLGVPFLLNGVIPLGNHMNFIKLQSGRFIALSTVALDESTLKQVNELTHNGTLLDAVIATNPFHTLAFTQFHKAFPHARYYGTPRHIRNLPAIPWTGSVADESVRKLWSPEIEMRIPAGCEFDAPVPENLNHFSGIIALHVASKTLISDDAFNVTVHPSFFKSLFGAKHGHVTFFMTLHSQGIDQRPEAPKEFYVWMEALLRDWDFDNMATAHSGVLIGGAKKGVRELLQREKGQLSKDAVARGGVAF